MKRLLAVAAACCAIGAHAQKAADNVVTWQHLNKAWKDYRQCDTGEVSETFTESILRLMIEWKNIDALAEGMKDPEYASFIQAHLKSPTAQNDVKDVRSRATQSCPKGQSDVCKQIVSATEGAKPLDLSPMAPIPTGATK